MLEHATKGNQISKAPSIPREKRVPCVSLCGRVIRTNNGNFPQSEKLISMRGVMCVYSDHFHVHIMYIMKKRLFAVRILIRVHTQSKQQRQHGKIIRQRITPVGFPLDGNECGKTNQTGNGSSDLRQINLNFNRKVTHLINVACLC